MATKPSRERDGQPEQGAHLQAGRHVEPNNGQRPNRIQGDRLDEDLRGVEQIVVDDSDLPYSAIGKVDEVLTLPEVAELCKATLRSIQEAARRGELPARKIGRTWRCRRDEILEWLRGSRRQPVGNCIAPTSTSTSKPTENPPRWDWSDRQRNLGASLDRNDDLRYRRKHGKVLECSSRKGGTR